MEPGITFSPADFVAVFNQTLETAYPNVTIIGELANFRVSKNRWVYFDLKDEYASLKFFGTVYQLPGPLEDGLMLEVKGQPRLHPQYGFSINIQSIRPVGEGSLKRAAALLEAKLAAEGLFDPARKRSLPYPPRRIGLITSSESAAYADFLKVLNARWGGLEISLADVQVQGEAAPQQITAAINSFNTSAEPVEVLVLTRGGGSAEDLAAFSTEQVTRAVAGSRLPTLVAVGHETDVSLAELAADKRASTPSNAAELLVPDRRQLLAQLPQLTRQLGQLLSQQTETRRRETSDRRTALADGIRHRLDDAARQLHLKRQLLEVLDPAAAMKRGYAVVRAGGRIITSAAAMKTGQKVAISLRDGSAAATIDRIDI